MTEPSNYQINYSRAYPLSSFAAYPEWPQQKTDGAATDVAFLHSDYVVRQGTGLDDEIIFADASESWLVFCRDQLGFDKQKAEVLEDS